MVHLMTNPTKGPNGVYYYVKRVPKDLIDKIGKERYSISLRTKDPRDAKRLCGETDVQKEREFAALRVGPQPIPFRDRGRGRQPGEMLVEKFQLLKVANLLPMKARQHVRA
ncbi:DUF6538 domain-containing protein [Rhizobium sp. ZK1]|uniref:DUF6538 domain-containing protein n=1 Tax=Rhizobium sp. ZK1 TaxID=3389872 RepID=UPI0039F73F95